MTGPVTVALDAMGGDQAATRPSRVPRGGRRRRGARAPVRPRARARAARCDARASTSSTRPDVISHEEEPARAARERDDASVVTCMRPVREGGAEAAVSAGSTGAMLAAGLIDLRRIPGVLRPAIVQPLPSWKGPIVVLDCGATPDPRPNLLTSSRTWARPSRPASSACTPRVGLLSNGEEEGKGNRLVTRLLPPARRRRAARFGGNIEGRDIPLGAADVVVCDGFTGNVVLKVIEGAGRVPVRRDPPGRDSSWQGKIGGLLLRPKLRPLRDKVDPETYGGAYLVGLRAIAVKAHGDSGSVAIRTRSSTPRAACARG